MSTDAAATTAQPGLVRRSIPLILFLALMGGGVTILLFFWNQLLSKDDLGAAGLPIVAFVAGIAATFNPCGLPALPGFLTFTGAASSQADVPINTRRRATLSLAAALGAVSVILAVGLVIAAAGAGTKGLVAPHIRWVQLGVGIGLIALALLHLANRTERFPAIGAIMSLGSRVWDRSVDDPTPRGSYLFGVGFVAIGAG